ncbi:MAG: barstar family protein, partial [Oscillospiraceae bacterium]|nr:barstar family protein [Oscillospiraceae bacterium]
MKEIIIDAGCFTDRTKIHEILKTALDSENYIGNNLDALFSFFCSPCPERQGDNVLMLM